MSKYLIITYEICNMGGGQLYVLRRCKHLISKGYDVHIIVFYHNSAYFPLKDEFNNIPFHVFPEIGQTSSRYSPHRIRKTVNKIFNEVGKTSDMIIESHTLSTIEWGEIVAIECKGKHLAYSISDDKICNYNFEPGRRIFKYKLNKGQFYGCSSIGLKQIFGTEDVPSNFVNVGFDEKELVEKSKPGISFRKNDQEFVISTVGRLDKNYIIPLINGCLKLSRKYADHNFVLLIAGGSSVPGRQKSLEDYFEMHKVHNLKCVFTGYIDKLGKDFFNMSDVFVGMATASLNAISQCCLTINIDPNYGMKYSSGFFGKDTMNFAFTEDGIIYDIFEKLEEAFLMSDDEKMEIVTSARKLFCESFDEKVCLNKLDDAISTIDYAEDATLIKVSCFYRLYVFTLFSLYNILKRVGMWNRIKKYLNK